MTYKPFIEPTRGAYGEIMTASRIPVVQIENKYKLSPDDLPADVEVFTQLGGIGTNNENKFQCQTGTTPGAFGIIRSRETINYQAGQGIEGTVTASFTAGVANSSQFAGMFNLTDILAFGFDGTEFSCLHASQGNVELQVITITATGVGTCTVTLDGDSVAIPVTSSSTEINATELLAGLEADVTLAAKWQFEQLDSRVFCIAEVAEDRTGTMSVVGGVTASISEERVGRPRISANIAQSSWSERVTPFVGFDPTKLNVYRVKLGYPALNIIFSIYDPDKDDFTDVHIIKWASTSNDTHISSPNLKIGWVAASVGSTTNLTIEGPSGSLMAEGPNTENNDAHAFANTKSGVGTTLTNIITLRSRTIQGDQFNLGKVRPIRVSFAVEHNKGVIIEIVKNPDVAGIPIFLAQDENKSIASLDVEGTTVTGGEVIDGFVLEAIESVVVDLNSLRVKLLPTDRLTIAARTITGTSTNMSAVLTWKEEK